MSANPPTHHLAVAPAAGSRLDVAIEWASGLTAVGMFAYGSALSYSVLYSIATAVGLPPLAAVLAWHPFLQRSPTGTATRPRRTPARTPWRTRPSSGWAPRPARTPQGWRWTARASGPLLAPDAPPVHPSGSDTSPVHLSAATPAGGVRQRLAAAYGSGRVDGGAWTARTLAQAAGWPFHRGGVPAPAAPVPVPA
jgi:hypothetical protein